VALPLFRLQCSILEKLGTSFRSTHVTQQAAKFHSVALDCGQAALLIFEISRRSPASAEAKGLA